MLVGLSAAAGHLVVVAALVSAGTVLAGALTDNFTDVVDAQGEAVHRMRDARSEDVELESDFYRSDQDQVMANWTNDGGEELRFDELHLLVAGEVTDKDTVDRFEVRDATSSEVWAPGEILEVRVSGQGNADLGIVAHHGAADYRRS